MKRSDGLKGSTRAIPIADRKHSSLRWRVIRRRNFPTHSIQNAKAAVYVKRVLRKQRTNGNLAEGDGWFSFRQRQAERVSSEQRFHSGRNQRGGPEAVIERGSREQADVVHA